MKFRKALTLVGIVWIAVGEVESGFHLNLSSASNLSALKRREEVRIMEPFHIEPLGYEAPERITRTIRVDSSVSGRITGSEAYLRASGFSPILGHGTPSAVNNY